MQQRAIYSSEQVDCDLWIYGFESGMGGDFVRADCAHLPETRLWLASIVRSLLDHDRPHLLKIREREDLRWFFWSDEITPCNLCWIADHISADPSKLISMVRKAVIEHWPMYGAKIQNGTGELRGKFYRCHRKGGGRHPARRLLEE